MEAVEDGWDPVCPVCGERWRCGVSMPDTPTKTLCEGCEEAVT